MTMATNTAPDTDPTTVTVVFTLNGAVSSVSLLLSKVEAPEADITISNTIAGSYVINTHTTKTGIIVIKHDHIKAHIITNPSRKRPPDMPNSLPLICHTHPYNR